MSQLGGLIRIVMKEHKPEWCKAGADEAQAIVASLIDHQSDLDVLRRVEGRPEYKVAYQNLIELAGEAKTYNERAN